MNPRCRKVKKSLDWNDGWMVKGGFLWVRYMSKEVESNTLLVPLFDPYNGGGGSLVNCFIPQLFINGEAGSRTQSEQSAITYRESIYICPLCI